MESSQCLSKIEEALTQWFAVAVHKQRDVVPLNISDDIGASDEDDEHPVFDFKVLGSIYLFVLFTLSVYICQKFCIILVCFQYFIQMSRQVVFQCYYIVLQTWKICLEVVCVFSSVDGQKNLFPLCCYIQDEDDDEDEDMEDDTHLTGLAAKSKETWHLFDSLVRRKPNISECYYATVATCRLNCFFYSFKLLLFCSFKATKTFTG